MNKQITAMPRYEAYKDSGIEWLGYIPSKWNKRESVTTQRK